MSSPSRIVWLSLPAMMAVIAGLSIVALLLALHFQWGYWRIAFFAIPAVVAGYYLNEYRKLPYEPYRFWPQRPAATVAPATAPAAPTASPASAAPEEEPFVDPVEEADRLAAAGDAPPTDTTDATPGDDAESRP